MQKLFIIDAVNFLFRSYFGIGPMTNAQGESTNALYGFIRSLNKIIKDFAPTHLIAVFDGPDNKKSRKDIYGEYKAHRTEMPADLFPQLEKAVAYCEMASIPILMIPGIEADDTMGSIAKWAELQGADVFICSSDKDLCQVVSNKISVINAHKDNLIINPLKVKELFGVNPDQMIDYLAMVGDTSDNIPGLEGFGPKTASDLLNKFGTLDAILANPEGVSGKKRETLIKDKEIVLLSRQLATIDLNVPFPQEEAFFVLKPPQHAQLEVFYKEMNFLSLLKEIEKSAPVPEEAVHYSIITTSEELKALITELQKEPEIAIACMTEGNSPLTVQLIGISFCIEKGKAFYVPLQDNKSTYLPLLKTLFENPHIAFTGYSLKSDLHAFYNARIFLSTLAFDVLIASQLLEPQHQKHDLNELMLTLFNKKKISLEDMLGKGKNQLKISELPTSSQASFCSESADFIFRLTNILRTKLEENQLTALFVETELPMITVLLQMERIGIYVDPVNLHHLSREFSAKLKALEVSIFTAAGEEFNINSPKQLGNILFETMGIKPLKKTTTGYSTAADVLESLKEENPIIHDILAYRGLEKLRSTYVDSLPEQISPETHRIHCTFNQIGAATGRLSCQDPNLQNIPVRSEDGRKIRAAFKPQKEGWSLLSADYSQIELRLLAHLSEDPSLIKAFCQGEDVHAYTASLVFNVPLNEVTAEMRHHAKAVNFGIMYGQQAFGLSQGLDIDYKEAATFIDTYFERYQKVKEFFETNKEVARKTGKATTLFGRQRPIPEINNKNPLIRSGAERLAMNTPLQGTTADLMKMAMLQIDALLDKDKHLGLMLLQIHDELLFEVPDAHVHELAAAVKDIMENLVTLKVPLIVDISIGKNWGEC